jgi:hypothetical protein
MSAPAIRSVPGQTGATLLWTLTAAKPWLIQAHLALDLSDPKANGLTVIVVDLPQGPSGTFLSSIPRQRSRAFAGARRRRAFTSTKSASRLTYSPSAGALSESGTSEGCLSTGSNALGIEGERNPRREAWTTMQFGFRHIRLQAAQKRSPILGV